MPVTGEAERAALGSPGAGAEVRESSRNGRQVAQLDRDATPLATPTQPGIWVHHTAPQQCPVPRMQLQLCAEGASEPTTGKVSCASRDLADVPCHGNPVKNDVFFCAK